MSSGTGAPELDRLEREALEEFSSAEDASRLEQIRLGFLGKKGTLTEVLRGLGKLPPEER